MGQKGNPIHGERIVDGDASVLTALTLFRSGGFTADTPPVAVERTLAAKEYLIIARVTILCETGGDVALVAGAVAAAGKYIVEGNLIPRGGITKDYGDYPYVCPVGVVPYFSGPASNKTTCIIEGYIAQG